MIKDGESFLNKKNQKSTLVFLCLKMEFSTPWNICCNTRKVSEGESKIKSFFSPQPHEKHKNCMRINLQKLLCDILKKVNFIFIFFEFSKVPWSFARRSERNRNLICFHQPKCGREKERERERVWRKMYKNKRKLFAIIKDKAKSLMLQCENVRSKKVGRGGRNDTHGYIYKVLKIMTHHTVHK